MGWVDVGVGGCVSGWVGGCVWEVFYAFLFWFGFSLCTTESDMRGIFF